MRGFNLKGKSRSEWDVVVVVVMNKGNLINNLRNRRMLLDPH